MGITTSADVCNLALIKVGQRQLLIDSLDEQTEVAMACKAIYAHTRDLVLTEAQWSFATIRATLALTTQTRDGWTYAYAVPTNCIGALYLWTGVRNPPNEDRLPYDIELNDTADGQLLLTDAQNAQLVYCVAVTNEDLFSPAFVEALACKLAMELVRAIPVKPQFTASLQQEYRAALANAVSTDRQGVQADVEMDGSLIRVRE